jgi:hypothetical protein
MPDNRITRYIPGKGIVVSGLKVLDGNENFKYSPITGPYPVQTQSKNAKETLVVNIPNCFLK